MLLQLDCVPLPVQCSAVCPSFIPPFLLRAAWLYIAPNELSLYCSALLCSVSFRVDGDAGGVLGRGRGSVRRSGSDLVGFYDGVDDGMWSKGSYSYSYGHGHGKRGSSETCEQRESEGEEEEEEGEGGDMFGDSIVMNTSSASVSTSNTSSTIYGSLLRK